jgi:GNAT superfamily N-acetyltransferase
MTISYRLAQIDDVQPVVNLINSAYRGEASKVGWTTEADFLDGVRTTLDEVTHLIQSKDTFFLLSFEENELIGCILAEIKEEKVRFGMFVIKPILQNRGLGKQLLEQAEQQVKQKWGISDFEMVVISCRKELLEYYERRGYFYSGKTLPFPLNPDLWTLKVEHLDFKIIEKN